MKPVPMKKRREKRTLMNFIPLLVILMASSKNVTGRNHVYIYLKCKEI